MSRIKMPLLLLFLSFFFSCQSPAGNDSSYVSMKTSMGDIKIKLYDGTPLHRDNFIKLVRSGFYEGVSFHRVIQDFMVQAGDPDTRTKSAKSFPDSLKTYTIPAEFNSAYYHKRGALAAARENDEVNPERRSSGTQFYLVQGVKYTDSELNQAEQKINSMAKQGRFSLIMKATADSLRATGKPVSDAETQQIASVKMFGFLSEYKDFKLPPETREIYRTIGGTPRLDGSYTVFGEITEGMDVVDKIAAVKTDGDDKPLDEVKILKIRIVKN